MGVFFLKQVHLKGCFSPWLLRHCTSPSESRLWPFPGAVSCTQQALWLSFVLQTEHLTSLSKLNLRLLGKKVLNHTRQKVLWQQLPTWEWIYHSQPWRHKYCSLYLFFSLLQLCFFFLDPLDKHLPHCLFLFLQFSQKLISFGFVSFL